MKIRFAVAPTSASFSPDGYREFVVGLEERRFDTLWLSDIPLGGGVEPVVGLGIAAGLTSRLKLGANIVPIGRSGVHLARQLAQLDQVSGGRILLMIVPGVGSPAEREALGVGPEARSAGGFTIGGELERLIAELRDHWQSGPVRPVQDPLEVWLGGRGPKALERVGRIGDGWLGSAMLPEEVAVARRVMDESASRAGREVDPEHFGMAIPCCVTDPGDEVFAAAARRRPDVDPRLLMPVGRDALRALLERYIDAGCSKFVVHPIQPDLDWLAEAVLPLQT